MFRDYRPLTLRVWHWLNALVVTSLLLTVLLRDTLFRPRANAEHFRQVLRDQGVEVNQEQALKLARPLVERLWDWHVWLGFALTALLVFRLIFARSPIFRGLRGHFKRGLHPGSVKVFYAAFYVSLFVSVVSGLMLNFSSALGLAENLEHSIGEVHEFLQWPTFAFVILHVIGVVVAENGTDPGLVSDMIHGGEERTD